MSLTLSLISTLNRYWLGRFVVIPFQKNIVRLSFLNGKWLFLGFIVYINYQLSNWTVDLVLKTDSKLSSVTISHLLESPNNFQILFRE